MFCKAEELELTKDRKKYTLGWLKDCGRSIIIITKCLSEMKDTRIAQNYSNIFGVQKK